MRARRIRSLLLSSALAVALMPLTELAAHPPEEETQFSEKENFRFRHDHEREHLRGKSAYRKFQDQEGIPVYKGFAVNLYEAKLGPWQRLGPGVTGAYFNLDGSGDVADNVVTEIEPGKRTNPERHISEEYILILSGEGETRIWQNDPNKKTVIPWRKGTVFSPPLNTWHEHINKGTVPARMVATTDLPLKLDLFRDQKFIFNNNYSFTDRYSGSPDYFDPEVSKDFGPLKDGSHSLSIVNLVRNAWTWRLFHAGQGYKDVDRHFIMSGNSMESHIEQFPTGTYERAHRHGPAATIVLLNGTGYSLMWPASLGITPWKDDKKDKVQRVDWGPGTMVVPPVDWFHQHFNTGPQPARFIKLGGTPGTELTPMTSQIMESWRVKTEIPFREEDVYVRDLFERELAVHGAKIQMPSRAELIELEKKSGDGPLMVP